MFPKENQENINKLKGNPHMRKNNNKISKQNKPLISSLLT